MVYVAAAGVVGACVVVSTGLAPSAPSRVSIGLDASYSIVVSIVFFRVLLRRGFLSAKKGEG